MPPELFLQVFQLCACLVTTTDRSPGDPLRMTLSAPSSRWCGRMMTCRPLRCADVPTYDSISDSPIHGLSFRPIPVVVGALRIKRCIVQNGASEMTWLGKVSFWTNHRFNMRAPTTITKLCTDRINNRICPKCYHHRHHRRLRQSTHTTYRNPTRGSACKISRSRRTATTCRGDDVVR